MNGSSFNVFGALARFCELAALRPPSAAELEAIRARAAAPAPCVWTEALRAFVVVPHPGLRRDVATLLAEVARLDALAAARLFALRRYGNHRPSCFLVNASLSVEVDGLGSCTCGYDAACADPPAAL